MPTTKKRLNLSLAKDIDEALSRVAKRDQMPQATKAEHLLRLALELEEDEALNTIAEGRDTRRAKFLTHKSAWQ